MLKTGEIAFGKYRILQLLGKGGMGRVYLAENVNVGNKWAIKEIEHRPGSPSGLLVEPEILKRLNHPNLPRIVDVIKSDTRIYIIEDYFEGQNLQKLLEIRKAVNEETAVKWARQLAGILVYLHNLKPAPIIYSDLKPGNIIIDKNEDLKLVDFGISRESRGGSSQGGFGSKGYAAPEQYRGIYDERTDIYGFGATFYHVLTGRRYDPANSVKLREVNKYFSEGIDYIIHKCLEQAPERRYQSASALYHDLRFIDRFSREYKIGKLRRVLAALGIAAMMLLGIASIGKGVEERELTSTKLYQQRIDAGISLAERGEYTQAEDSFLEALKYKNEPEVYHNLARLYLRENRASKAIEFLEEKIRTGVIKDDAATSYLLGSAYFALNDYARAALYFDRCIQDSQGLPGEDYEAAVRDLGVSYCRMGDFSKAREVLNTLEASKGSTTHVTSYVLGEVEMAQKNYSRALAYFERAQKGDSTNIEYKLGTARLYEAMSAQAASQAEKVEYLKRAVATVKAAQEIDPYHIQAISDYGKYCFELGQLYQSSGEETSVPLFQQALLAFNKLVDIGIVDGNTYLNIAMIHDKLGNYAAAEQAFQEALRLDEGDSHTNFVYGLFKLKHKQYETAYKYLQKTVDLNKDSYEVSVARARIAELREKGWI